MTAHTAADAVREHLDWVGRKKAALRRLTLDCGCPNTGEVSFHLWCDRLACALHADDLHDCSAFAGAKDGSEEVSELAEVAVEVPLLPLEQVFEIRRRTPEERQEYLAAARARHVAQGAPEPWLEIFDALAAVDPPPAPDRVADAFRDEVLRQGLTECEIDGIREVYRDGDWTIIDETHVWRRRMAEVDPVAFRRAYMNERVVGRASPEEPMQPGPGSFTRLEPLRPPWVELPPDDDRAAFPLEADLPAAITPCGDHLDGPFGEACCDLPAGHDGVHADWHGTFWTDRRAEEPTTNGRSPWWRRMWRRG